MLLYQKLNSWRDDALTEYRELPIEIKRNLKKELRPYQVEAFRHFVSYFEKQNLRQKPTQTLFHMATGSGKTLIMAGLMLYLYKKGYRDFIFFVNTNNIITKTKENFINVNSTKYLFKDDISIGGSEVEINEINNFSERKQNAINILFCTTAKLHSDMNNVKENSISYDDFENRKMVLIADEAHHLNASTKKKLTTAEKEDIDSWEKTVNKILKANAENVLLEFTATFEESNEDIVKAYNDKIIYKYDLKKFRNDGYSKEIEIVKTKVENIMDRALLGVLFSQYRLKLFNDNNLNIKPCILFKSDTIANSKKNREDFSKMIKELTGDKIKKLLDSFNKNEIEPTILQQNNFYNMMIKYFIDKNISYDNLADEIKLSFSEPYIISANDDDEVMDKQKVLNSLEDSDNHYRAIFEVRKLDEGWDVLNLFDIVRLYETRQSGDKKLAPATISEAQLIGRGARYCPFKIEGNDAKEDKRKFDDDLLNSLRILETLLYHCQNDSKYIAEIHSALVESGAIDEKREIRTYKVKETFKNTEFYKSAKIYVNDREERAFDDTSGVVQWLREKDYNISENASTVQNIKIMDEIGIDTDNDDNLKETTLPIKDIMKLNRCLVRKAMQQFRELSFNNLHKFYPQITSLSDFIVDDKYMGEIKIKFKTRNGTPTLSLIYSGVIKVCATLAMEIINRNKLYKGTEKFVAKKIKDIVKDKTISLDDIVEEGHGSSQNASDKYKVNLQNADWFVYDDNYGTSEEKAFVKYFDKIYKNLEKKYDKVYLFRNERQFHLYSFDDGSRFEPDYVLFLLRHKTATKKDGDPNFIPVANENLDLDYEQLQVFIEPKGEHLLSSDKWKEDFLLKIKDLNLSDSDINTGTINGRGVWGLHFYNEENKEKREEFENDMEKLFD